MTFEMLAGKLPFEAPTLQGFMHAHLEVPAPRLGEAAPALAGTAWERAIARCLEKRPEDRPESALAFLRALEEGRPRRRRIVPLAMAALSLAAALFALVSSGSPRPLRVGTPEIVGPLDAEAGRAVARTLEPAIRECHALTPLATASRLHLVIAKDGTAKGRVQPENEALERCLEPAIDRLRLPPLVDGRFAAVTLAIDFADDP